MITNGSITIYHYDEEGGTYTPYIYRDASIYSGVRVAVKNSGFVNDSFLRIRIATENDILIGTDDYVYIGETEAPVDKSVCMKVVAYGDNRRGALPHWRIECGQKYRR